MMTEKILNAKNFKWIILFRCLLMFFAILEAVFEKEGEVKDEVENPKTNDNIMFIITIAIASTALLTISLKKVLVK